MQSYACDSMEICWWHTLFLIRSNGASIQIIKVNQEWLFSELEGRGSAGLKPLNGYFNILMVI